MRTVHDYGGPAVVQGLTSQSKICFSRVLVPAESFLCVCLFWRWLGGPLLWNEPGYQVCWF